MSDEPQTPVQEKNQSSIAGVSIRGWIAVILVGSFCIVCIVDLAMAIMNGKDPSPILLTALVGQVSGAVSFYFGQKGKTE